MVRQIERDTWRQTDRQAEGKGSECDLGIISDRQVNAEIDRQTQHSFTSLGSVPE